MAGKRNRLWVALSMAMWVGGGALVPAAAAEDKTHAAVEEANPEGAGEPASGAVTTLDEIVVTARKRSESVRDIPTSIDAFTGERLAELGYTSVEDVLKLSPGVTFESGFTPSSTTVIVRGITTDSRGVGPRTVGRFYAKVPLTT